MEAFIRGLLFFLVGVIVGAGAVLFYTPSFNVVVTRSTGARPALELVSAPPPVAAPVQVTVAPVAVPVAPPVIGEVKPTPPPAVTVAAVEPPLDFKALSEHLVLWPNSVRVKVATMAPVRVDGKMQDLALEAGTVLQVSKVMADGSLEVRAKGAKFEIKSARTDFSDELAKRVAELVLKGTQFASPYAPAAMATPGVVEASPPVASLAPAVVLPKAPRTLAQRVDVLFGVKPEAAEPPSSAGISAPALAAEPPQVAPLSPAPTTSEQKAIEKGKDLDQKINQLFK